MCCLWLTNSTIIWAVVRTFVAMDCNKTYAGGVNLHKFPKRNERLETAVSVNVMVICAM